MKLSLIAALGTNRAIGVDNKLPWHLPDDLKHFKKLTEGHAIIMGRKTYESIGRLLPNRKNIILTRDKNYAVDGAIIVHSLESALDEAREDSEVFVIGGAQIFELALPRAHKMYLTHVDAKPEDGVLFPEFNKSEWKETESQFHDKDTSHEYSFTFKTYEKTQIKR